MSSGEANERDPRLPAHPSAGAAAGAPGLLRAIGRLESRRARRRAVLVSRPVDAALRARATVRRLSRQTVSACCALCRLPFAVVATGLPLVGVLALGASGHRLGFEGPVPESQGSEPQGPEPVAPASKETDPEVEAVAHEQTRLVVEALRHLPWRQRYVIARHFGLDGDAVSLSTIAHELHVSSQRAKAIEQRALHELAIALSPLLGDRQDS